MLSGASVHIRDSSDHTPLMAAVQNGHLEVDTTNCRSAEELKNDKNQVIRLLVLAGAHLGLSSGELGLLFTSAAGQVREEVKYYLLVR